jgi:hypothetical protein
MKLSLKQIILLIFITLIAISFVAVFLILNRSTASLTDAQKQQALTKILGRPVVLKDKAIVTGDVLYKGKYYSFLYPEAATKYNSAQTNTSLESFKFDLSSPRIYAVTEVVAAGNSQRLLDDNSGIRLREVQNAIYQQATVSANGKSGLSFEKNDADGVEKTAFFLVNGKYYSFSLVGSDKSSIEDLFVKIITSLKFL